MNRDFGLASLTSLPAVFEAVCTTHASRTAYVFLKDDLSPGETLSYGALSIDVHRLAARLATRVRPGDRVLLALPPGLDVVRAFWACMLVGCVAVPVPAPDPVRLLRSAPRLRGILDDTDATLVWTSAELLDSARQSFEPSMFTAARWMSTAELEALGDEHAVPARLPFVASDALAYLQYTSGSTLAPRGVRITHRQALANVRALNAAGHVDGHSRVLTWLPHFHDYGLVCGLLAPFHAGATSWLMSPLTFLRRPLRWLEAVAALRITHTGAPMSAYVACLRALAGAPLASDLSSLISLNCGAEPLRADAVERVLEVFGAAGLRAEAFMPAYGMAETVLGVTLSTTDRPPRLMALDAQALQHDHVVPARADGTGAVRLVGCGLPLAHTTVRIVEPSTGTPVAADAVGEIWVQSPSIGSGYWRQPELSEASFGAHLDAVDGPFLRTGDLGFMADGELFVTGRLKDLVIVHGGNHYPQDLEWTAEHAHPALRPGYGAAFSVERPEGEALVLVLETERRTRDDAAEAAAAAVRRAIGEVHGLTVEAVVLVRSGSLPRSSSGKIQRRASRQLFLEGALDIQAASRREAALPETDAAADDAIAPSMHVMPRDAAEQEIWDIWREVLDTTAFGVHESFFELGGTSLLMTQVASRVSQELGVELPLAALFEHTSVATLADHVTRLLTESGGTPSVPLAMARVPRGVPLPVSLSQRRMWVIQQFDPASTAYNVAISLRIRGALDVALLQRAFDRMAERHESLRTRLVLEGSEPMQRIEPAAGAPIEWIDLSGRPDRLAQARTLLAERLDTPFDLARAPLHRLTLLYVDDRDHVLLWVMHHAISDNWSFAVLMREVLSTYIAWRDGREPTLAPIPVEYADYAAWQRSPAQVAQRRPQMDYWRQRLAHLAPLDLPTDFARPLRPSFHGGRASATLPVSLRATLRAYGARASVTPFVVLLAAFKLMLMRQARGTDIAVGTPVANRHRFAAEHLVGTLVNTLVMRTELGGDPSFDTVVQRVRTTALEAYAHQEAPFDELVESLGHDRSVHPEGLVRVLFNVLNAPLGRLDHAGLEVEEFPFERATAQFDLAVHIDTEFTHRVHFEYSTDLYAHATVERMLENYLALLERLLHAPTLPVSQIPTVSPAQRALLQGSWNATQRPLPAEQTVHRYLVGARAGVEDRVAVIDARGRTFTHGELEARANALARTLRSRGIGRGHRVGLGVARDAGLLVALLGVLKSGAAYVPLDPGFPEDRLRFMAEDAGLSALVVHGVPTDWLASAGVPVLALDGLLTDIAPGQGAALDTDAQHDAGPLDPAYMIYTSGSTGRPKGVAVPHRAVVNFLASMAREPGLAADDRLVAVTTLSFDIAVLELLLPLAVGARVVLADASQVQDPHALRDLVARERATVMQATPTLWRMLLDAGWRRPDDVPHFKALIGGEPLPAALAERLLAADVELWNMYGPTETTVWSTVWRVTSPRDGIAIGRPIDNTDVQVRDLDGQLCPIGVPGELCIGGAGVTLGYHQRDELTADRFPPDLDSDAPGARFYRTGDLGRWRHDGWLEHLGRLDRQVKLRGLRIELGEIEAALRDHPAVAESIVATHAQGDEDVRLVAYVVPRGDAPDGAVLRDHLRTRLPDYMLPQHVVMLDALPLLPNGKIDRNALPAPHVEVHAAARLQRAVPTTPAERAIAAVWCELLGIDVVDLRDNFFDLGGHSLLAMRAVVAIRERLGWHIQPPRFVYETLGQLARAENISVS